LRSSVNLITDMAKDKVSYLLMFCGIFLVMILLLYILIGRPVLRYANQVRRDFNLKQATLQEEQELIRSLPNPQSAVEGLKVKMQEIQDMGASKRQVPKVMQVLSQAAADKNITVVSLRPRDDIKTEDTSAALGVTKVYVELILKCGYQELAEFVKGLGSLPMSLNVESLLVEKSQKELDAASGRSSSKENTAPSTLDVTLVLSTIFG